MRTVRLATRSAALALLVLALAAGRLAALCGGCCDAESPRPAALSVAAPDCCGCEPAIAAVETPDGLVTASSARVGAGGAAFAPAVALLSDLPSRAIHVARTARSAPSSPPRLDSPRRL